MPILRQITSADISASSSVSRNYEPVIHYLDYSRRRGGRVKAHWHEDCDKQYIDCRNQRQDTIAGWLSDNLTRSESTNVMCYATWEYVYEYV